MKQFFLLLALGYAPTLPAQDMSYSVPGKNYFTELKDASPSTGNWAQLKKPVNMSFASGDVRYAKKAVPTDSLQTTWNGTGWKGERIHTQVLIWTTQAIAALDVNTDELTSAVGGKIPAAQVSARYIRYVMTDEFAEGCGYRKPANFDSSLAPDAIDLLSTISVEANTVQPVWLSIQVPANTVPGVYKGNVLIKADKQYSLPYTVTVVDKLLPPANQWTFDLDLWQHPAAIARVHGVPLWSDQHFTLMKPYYTMLAAAGQKNITASIMEEPWGHQTFDDFPSLIKWTKKKNGSWSYDYTLFDKYVAFVMECGIRKRINCYTMVPWSLSFAYFDEASGKDTALKAAIGSPEYVLHWNTMLTNFTQHLKEKKWFDITSIAMDERPMKDLQVVIAMLKKIDPTWKVALAGNYHPEIEKDIFDYCLASNLHFDDTVLKERLAKGKPSTYYTCCSEHYPNGFTFSPPAEHVWIGWFAAAKGFTGYLRWAYNSWVGEPLLDSRFRTWPAGDTYQIYPGPRSSIRFEKMVEGIQDFEKIRLLRQWYTEKGNTQALKKLEAALATFDIEKLKTMPAAAMVNGAKSLLNE